MRACCATHGPAHKRRWTRIWFTTIRSIVIRATSVNPSSGTQVRDRVKQDISLRIINLNFSAALFRHNRVVHEGYKPYGCNYCEQSFSKSETLKHHLMRHTGERPHACPVCDYRFIQIVALKRHMKIHSKPVSERKKRKKTETIIS